MKEIKAFIHRSRIADVVHALKSAGFNTPCICNVKGMFEALDTEEQAYSAELGEAVITEIKLEMVCEDSQVDEAICLIQRQARTAHTDDGWIYIIDIDRAVRIDGKPGG